MVNYQEMEPEKLYINRYSKPSMVYKKSLNGLLLFRCIDPKTEWKISTSNKKGRNFALCSDYGYREDGTTFETFFPSTIRATTGLIGIPV